MTHSKLTPAPIDLARLREHVHVQVQHGLMMEVNPFELLAILNSLEQAGAQNDILVNALETAIAALRFYENRDNYDLKSGAVSCLQPKGLEQNLFKVLDFGDTARAALLKLRDLGLVGENL